MAVGPEALRRLSELLDTALELPESERDTWFAALQGDDAALALTLRDLLARQASDETSDLMDAPPAFTIAGAPANASELHIGDTVGPYRLERLLGHGGMGEVWLAERSDGSLKRKVALKLPHVTWAPGLTERFSREREILSGLEHPNIARLYDAGVDAQGRPYMALEYVDGRPIDEYCKERALAVEARLGLLMHVANAVAFAHSHLVIHRDLKPGNILVTADGQVRLLDFGIAKLMEGDSAQETALTKAAGRALTLDYASPEQIRGESIGTASDVYSLGVVAFELLAGARPYRLKRSAAALEEAIANEDAPLASALVDDPTRKKTLQGDLDAILNQALKKGVGDRYPTVDALARDWRRYLDGQRVLARPDTLIYRLTRLAARYRMPLIVGGVAAATFVLAIGFGATAVVILALLLGLGAALWQARRAAYARDRAVELNARNEAVSEFLNTVLTQAARSGQPLTADQLLSRSEDLIEREFKDKPEHRAAVLGMMAMNSYALGNPGKSLALLERALVVMDSSGDRAFRDKLLIQQALARGASGQVDQAFVALQEIVARPSTQSDNRAEAHQYLAAMAQHKNDAAVAMEHAVAALQCLRESKRRSPRLEASLVAMLGHSCHVCGRNDEADRHYADAMDRTTALGQERSPNALALLNNWALVKEGSGDLPAALALYDQALAVAVFDAPDAPKSPFITVNRARTLDLTGRLPEAEAAYKESLQLALDLRVPPVQIYAETGLASLAISRGDISQAENYLALAQRGPGDKSAAGTKEALLRLLTEGRLALLKGDAEAAKSCFAMLVGDRPPLASTIMGLLGKSDAHCLAGRLDLARADTSDALELAQQLQVDKRRSFRTGLAWLALAQLSAETGHLDDARREAVSAISQLENNVEDDHPGLLRARVLTNTSALAAVPTMTRKQARG